MTTHKDWRKLFLGRPPTIVSPQQMKGLDSTWELIIKIIREIKKESEETQESKKEKENKRKKKVLEDQIRDQLEETKPENVCTIEGAKHSIKILQNLQQEIRTASLQTSIEVEEAQKKLITGRLQTLLIHIDTLRENAKSLEYETKLKIQQQTSLIKAVPLPQLDSSLTFYDEWLPIFNSIKKGTNAQNLLALMKESLKSEDDKQVGNHPGSSPGYLLSYLLKKYLSETALVPEILKRLDSMEPPKTFRQMKANIRYRSSL